MSSVLRRATDSVRRVAEAVRSHPVASAILAVAVLALLALSTLMDLNLVAAVGLLAIVGIGAWVLYRFWQRRLTSDGPVNPSTAGRVGLAAVAVSGVVTFGVIQLVPYGRDHSNPPVTGEPRWANDRTRELTVNACFACHSNEVEYPAYASIAPISWLVQRHVDEGRDKVNYSEFATDSGEADNSVEVVEEGEMPPPSFTRFGRHPEAKLSDTELQELIDGLRATPGMTEQEGGASRDGD